jgi:uncharacterized LabA/DUF88 family protein
MDTKKSIKHKSQRVGVFIDVQNMYYSAKALYGRKVNFGEILKEGVADRQLIRAIAYVVRATGEEDPFFEALHQKGIETKERELQEFHGGAKKADWDVGITVDAIRIGEILDVVVLVSGDGDFVELVEYLKHHGKQVEVVSFKQSTSSKLIEAADDFVDLSEEKDRFTIKGSMRQGTIHRATSKDHRQPVELDNLKEPSEPAEKSVESFWIKPPEKKEKKKPTTRRKPTTTKKK